MAEDDSSDGRLFALYRRFIGEPDRPIDIYLGFALFFGGLAAGVIGFVVFIWSTSMPGGTLQYWRFREIAIVLAFLGLPAFILSIVVLLPVSRRVVYASSLGTIICLAAVGIFVVVYPQSWNVPTGVDYSSQGIAVYAAGLALLVASTGSALVAHHLERARPMADVRLPDDEAAAGVDDAEPEETVSDAQVRRDIEEAMADADLTWGGVRKTESKRLTITMDDPELDRSGLNPEALKTVRGGGVDDAVQGLRNMKGGARAEASGPGVDEQTAALQELRNRQAELEEQQSTSTIGRLRDRLGF